MTREEFLIDTLEYYSVDPVNRRCVDKNDQCYYDPEGIGKELTSDGCAFGRLLSKEDKITIPNVSIAGMAIHHKEDWNKFPEWIRTMERNFLRNIQTLHDNSDNWSLTGLSEFGKESINETIRIYNLEIDPETIKKYMNETVVS